MKDQPRVRFAPSPTGFLHVGGARTALFNWLYARHEHGVFILRIEDTDRERSRSQLTDAILEGLTWLGLDWDEGPFHQADGLERHRADVDRLLEKRAAYRCFCSPERLETLRDAARAAGRAAAYDRLCRQLEPEAAANRAAAGAPYTVRFRMPDGETVWDDVVGGTTRFQNADIEDFILLRSDGTPTYNLAVVSDDVAMRMTHVIRGADHLSNTPKQIQIYRALEASVPVFCHVPLILGTDGKRLSKRHGATAVGQYRKAGILPEAMANFLALLGWSPGDDRELMTVDELIERFSLQRINKKPAVFDQQKLEWLNGQHIAMKSAADLLGRIGPRLIEEGIVEEEDLASRREWYERTVDSVKTRARTLPELLQRVRFYYLDAVEYDREAVTKHWKDPRAAAEKLARLRAVLRGFGDWDAENLEAQVRALSEDMEIGAGKLIHPLRLALTGASVSPGIFEVLELMGRERVSARIDDALDYLNTRIE